jgi:hypothetical protein
MTNLEWAQRYWNAGWSIFPAQEQDGKTPHFQALKDAGLLNSEGNGSWKPLQKQRATKKMVDYWWTKYPNAGIKLVTGYVSGVTVLDVDGKDWKKSERIGLDILGTITMATKTGGGGYQFFCLYEPRHSGNVLGYECGVEIKNDAMSVTLAPSIHPKTGNQYAWWNMAPFSEGNIKNLALLPKTIHSEKTIPATEGDWLQMFNGVGSGNRNETAARVIGKMLTSMMSSFRGSPDFIPTLWDFAVFWNSRNTPPMPESELRTVFASIIRRAASQS